MSASHAAGHTPVSPLLPPVNSSHWKHTDHTICANASVSMARYTPDRRTQNQPKSRAPAAATSGATSSDTSIGRWKRSTSSAAPYAPSPKYAACPNECMPAGPMMKCRLAAKSAAVSRSMASTVA